MVTDLLHRLHTRWVGRRIGRGLLLGVLGAAACVDSPTATEPALAAEDTPLAQTFDALAQESARTGDLARSEGFSHVALAVRGGISPTRVELSLAGEVVSLDAYVIAADWETTIAAAARPVARRGMVAWRRLGNGALRVISLHTPSDSAPVLSPLSLGPAMASQAVYAGASILYQDIAPASATSSAVSAMWVATGGYVRIRELPGSVACPAIGTSASAIRGVACQQGRYVVRFESVVQRSTGRPWQLASSDAALRLVMPEHTVNGQKLRFSCVAPTSVRGCG